jgi:serine/threonine protein phosphatase PrpC
MFWQQRTPPSATAAQPRPEASLATDVGCHRELNEDSGRIVWAEASKHGNRGVLAVVADGMGGHQAGEVASQTAVETIEREYPLGKGTPGRALERAFEQAHHRIRQLSASNPTMQGMGTTCTAVAVVGAEAWAVHVGDSRLYLVRGDSIYQLSEDHTQCMEKVRQGLMTLEQARRHEDRNVLVRAMGSRPELAFMSWHEPMEVKPGDRFLVCSDGLHDMVADMEMRDVARGASAEDACRKLVTMARERGGYDNITVAVIAIPEAACVADAAGTREFGGVE